MMVWSSLVDWNLVEVKNPVEILKKLGCRSKELNEGARAKKSRGEKWCALRRGGGLEAPDLQLPLFEPGIIRALVRFPLSYSPNF